MPTISVIISAYNAENTILETIKSVQQQSFSDFELIIINDGSTDHTLEIIKTIEDSRIRLFSYENGGLPVARNRGIFHAIGELITFLDADDLWTDDKLELQLKALRQHPEAGVVYSWTYFMFEDNKKRSYVENSHCFDGNVYADLLLINFIHNGSNALIRKQAIESTGLFDTTLKSFEDWDYWLRLATNWSFVLVRKPQILYRQSSGSMRTNFQVMENAFFVVVDKAFKASPPELQFLKKQSLANGYQYFTQQYLSRSTTSKKFNDIRQASQNLCKAIHLHPIILLEKHTLVQIKWLVKQWLVIIFSNTLVNRN